MRAPLQTPYPPTSQPGISDVSAGTDISSNSWQQRPSLQGMALQVGSKPSSVHHALRGTQQTSSGTRAVLRLNEWVVISEPLAAEGLFMHMAELSAFPAYSC